MRYCIQNFWLIRCWIEIYLNDILFLLQLFTQVINYWVLKASLRSSARACSIEGKFFFWKKTAILRGKSALSQNNNFISHPLEKAGRGTWSQTTAKTMLLLLPGYQQHHVKVPPLAVFWVLLSTPPSTLQLYGSACLSPPGEITTTPTTSDGDDDDDDPYVVVSFLFGNDNTHTQEIYAVKGRVTSVPGPYNDVPTTVSCTVSRKRCVCVSYICLQGRSGIGRF